jgi:threonyl-tRNA synthetase
MITNLEDGTITFCDHDTLLIYVVVVILIQESSKHESNECCRSLLEENKQLTRVYGTSFKTEDLTEYLALLEEAKRRDHRNWVKN